jgi:hypothetical protein
MLGEGRGMNLPGVDLVGDIDDELAGFIKIGIFFDEDFAGAIAGDMDFEEAMGMVTEFVEVRGEGMDIDEFKGIIIEIYHMDTIAESQEQAGFGAPVLFCPYIIDRIVCHGTGFECSPGV